MAARNDRFWCDLQFKGGMLPLDEASKADLSMGGCLDDNVKKRSCCKTVLIGPLLDGYIGQLGMQFKNLVEEKTPVYKSQLIYSFHTIYSYSSPNW